MLEEREDEELLALWQNLRVRDEAVQQIDLWDYVNADEEVATDDTNQAEATVDSMEIDDSDSEMWYWVRFFVKIIVLNN